MKSELSVSMIGLDRSRSSSLFLQKINGYGIIF